MDISYETTASGAATAIANAPAVADPKPAFAEDDPRLVALRAAAAALLPAAGLAATDTVEMSLAMSDEPGWAVVRVSQLIPAS